MYVCVCYVCMLRVSCNCVCICVHTCNYVYNELLLRYIHFYVLFEPGLARSPRNHEKSVDRKEKITIDRDQVPPRLIYCKAKVSPAHYYNNLLLLDVVFYGDKCVGRDVSRSPLSVSRFASSDILAGGPVKGLP